MTAFTIAERRKKDAEKTARWRALNPEKNAESHRKYRLKRSKQRAKDAFAWRARNKDHVRQYQREYDANRRDKRNAEKRTIYAANTNAACAVSREWRRNNPEAKRAQKLKYRARKRGAKGSHTGLQLQTLLEIQNFLCANPHCRNDLRTIKRHPDHIISLSHGGSNSIENLQWLCQPCNSRKSNLDPVEWLRREAERMITTA